MKPMKKLLFLIASVFFFSLNSCSSDDSFEGEPTLVGKWKFSKGVSYDIESGKTTTSYPNECGKKNIYEFTTDNNLIETSYTNLIGQCSEKKIVTNKFTLENNSFWLDNYSDNIFEIKKLTHGELVTVNNFYNMVIRTNYYKRIR